MKRIELVDLPGYKAWIRGGTRQEMQAANEAVERPCYCASLWAGYCDFCTGLAADGGERWRSAVYEMHGGANQKRRPDA